MDVSPARALVPSLLLLAALVFPALSPAASGPVAWCPVEDFSFFVVMLPPRS